MLLALSLLGFTVVAYLVGGYFGVPYLVKSLLTRTLAHRLDRPVTIGQAGFNPFTLRLTLMNGIVGPRLSDPADKIDPILSFSTLTLDLEAISLVERALICRELSLDQPFIHLVHARGNRFNLATLLPDAETPATTRPPATLAALLGQRYSLNNIAITNGEVLYDDLPAAKVHRLEKVNLTLPAVANISYQSGELKPRFSALMNGTPLAMIGEAQLAAKTMTARLTMKLTELSLAAYQDYLPARLGVGALNGKADLDLELLYDTSRAEDLRLLGTISLRDAQVEAKLGQLSLDSGVIKGWVEPFANRYHADEITLHHPIWQEGAGAEHISWLGLIPPLLRPDHGQQAIMAVSHLQVTNGEARGVATWQAIDASINTAPLSPSDPGGPQQAFFSMNAHTPSGSNVILQGSAGTTPFLAKGLLVINTIDLATLRELGTPLGVSLPAGQGLVEQLQTNFSLGQTPDQGPLLALEPLSIQAKDLRIEHNGQTLEVPLWQSEQGSFKPGDPVLHLGRVRMQQARLTCRRQSESGAWQTLLSNPEDQTALPIDIGGLDLTNGSLLIENQGPPDITLRLERFDLQVDQITPGQANSLSGAAMLDDKFPIQATGSFSLSPFTASLNLQASDLPLSAFAPILAHYFVTPPKGTLTATGTLSLPGLDYQGQWTIASLSAPPLSCRRLSAEGTAFTPRPLSLAIDHLDLDGLGLRVIASENGFPDLPALMVPGWKPAEAKTAATVAIKAIDLKDGSLIYDLPSLGALPAEAGEAGHGSPPPRAGLTISHQGISGTITDFIVARDQAITFDLSGRMETKAEFTAQGSLTPFASQPGLTLTSRVTGLPLAALAPLLEPRWGYTVKAGTLDFANKLTFENSLIHDANQLAFHDLSLGRPLATPAIQAIGTTWQSLPLIQALLQDAGGTIVLTVPIDGRTDTGFTYPQGLANFLNQLLLKATVSPVNLLGDRQQALADPVEFEPGSDHLPPKAKEQLQGLADLLQDRPLLAADIAGVADHATDTRALARRKKKGSTPPGDEALRTLATRRARAVSNFLIDQGVAPTRIHLAPPELIASGKTGRTGRRVRISPRVAR